MGYSVANPNIIKIGVDIRTLNYVGATVRGIGHYVMNFLEAVSLAAPWIKFRLYLDVVSQSENIKKLLQKPNFEIGSFENIKSDRLDLFLMPDVMSLNSGYDSPFLLAPEHVPLYAIFYDMIPYVKKELIFDYWDIGLQSAYLKRLEDLRKRRVKILAISQCTKNDLVVHAGLCAEDVAVVYAGINNSGRSSLPNENEINEVVSKYGLRKPFFMTVGALDIHKNFASAVNAFIVVRNAVEDQSKKMGFYNTVHFAVVGSLDADPEKAAYKKDIESQGINNIVFTGYISRNDLECLYASASGLVFVSEYEGFGFPVLEAMANNCPVITSNTSSIPEVANNAAILVNPKDVKAIAEAMVALINSPEIRNSLVMAGNERSKMFSWTKVADSFLEQLASNKL